MANGRVIRMLTAAGLAIAAIGTTVAAAQGANSQFFVVAAALVIAAVGIASWSRLAYLTPFGFAVAIYPATSAFVRHLRSDASDLGAFALLMLCVVFAAAISAIAALPSRRGPVPSRHLAWPLAAGAAAGLWFFILESTTAPDFLLPDGLLGVGFALATTGLCLPLRGPLPPTEPAGI